ncbi:putative 2-aminoethylphosphonate ABC transporter substrate-binding protein [Clostridia bacterium]|nr:putative 2-aminoethylphosphonate ABC transporter substrate-binding protein [Clostridia bacterium]
MKRSLCRMFVSLVLVVLMFNSYALASSEHRVVIYTSSDENELALARQLLNEEFPGWDIVLEYISTGNHAARLKAEGIVTECDISYDLEYGYMAMLDAEGLYASLADYDTSKYIDDLITSQNLIPTMRYGGAIIINTKVLNDKGLPEPKSYGDLLKPEYRGLISMPSPKASGTGYMFYKSLVNAWGEAEALDYFDALGENILQFSSSGSAPVNSLVQEEVAIALGMTSHAALKITEGNPLKILFFEEGSPYAACGAAIIKGKENNPDIQAVFRFFYETVTEAICAELYPEQIYKGKTFTMENYPENITYANMDNNTPEEKERLLDQWIY